MEEKASQRPITSKKNDGLWAWGKRIHVPVSEKTKEEFRDLASSWLLSQAELGHAIVNRALKDPDWCKAAVLADRITKHRVRFPDENQE